MEVLVIFGRLISIEDVLRQLKKWRYSIENISYWRVSVMVAPVLIKADRAISPRNSKHHARNQ